MALVLHNMLHVAATWIGCVLLVGLLHLQERVTSRHIAHHLGWRAVLVTGWLGVPLHELSHLLAAWLFNHRIIAFRLFDPDPVTGTLGYVRHAYSRRSVWQLGGSFFIAVAPLVGGAIALSGILVWIAPPAAWHALTLSCSTPRGVLDTMGAAVATLWEHRSWLFPLQLYLAIAVASHMAPSRADLRGGLWGGLALLSVTLGGAGLAAHLGHRLTQGATLLGLLLLVLLAAGLFQGIYAVIVTIAARTARRPTLHASR